MEPMMINVMTLVSITAVLGVTFLSAWGARKHTRYQIKKLTEERDTYRKIAESHEVKWTGWPEDDTAKVEWRPVAGWENREFDDAIETNLERLKKALEDAAHGDEDAMLRLEIKVFVKGAWKAKLSEKWNWKDKNNGEPSEISQISNTFDGNVTEILSELRANLRDRHWWLTLENGRWQCPNDPISFDCKLSKAHFLLAPKKPEVRFVEVQVAKPTPVDLEHEAADIVSRLEVDPDLDKAVVTLRKRIEAMKKVTA